MLLTEHLEREIGVLISCWFRNVDDVLGLFDQSSKDIFVKELTFEVDGA
jgi:hypothetical protein